MSDAPTAEPEQDPAWEWWRRPQRKPTPILPGWRITWRDLKIDRITSATVRSVVPVGKSYRITTVDGIVVTPDKILAVARLKAGQVVEIWTTRDHGLDGMGGRTSTLSRPLYKDW